MFVLYSYNKSNIHMLCVFQHCLPEATWVTDPSMNVAVHKESCRVFCGMYTAQHNVYKHTPRHTHSSCVDRLRVDMCLPISDTLQVTPTVTVRVCKHSDPTTLLF